MGNLCCRHYILGNAVGRPGRAETPRSGLTILLDYWSRLGRVCSMKISNVSFPQWSKDIKSLRSSLKVSQSEFGKSLRSSAMAVSRWERGQQPPPAECYLAMAKIAGPSFGWRFWSLVGISEDDVERMHAQRMRTKNEQHDFSAAVTILEIEVARSEARAKQRDTLFQDLPTQTLRREYQAIARAEANFARIVALHVKTLRSAIR